MAPNRDMERAFSQDVERLLRGEEPAGLSMDDAGYAETLRFARRLMAIREEPDPAFTARLRSHLMVNLAEEDIAVARTRESWFERLFGRPAVRLAVVSTVVVLVAVGLVWRAGYFSPMTEQAGDEGPSALMEGDGAPAPTMEEEAPEMAQATVEDEAAREAVMAPAAEESSAVLIGARGLPAYAAGEMVDITLVFENTGQDGVTLSPFPPAIDIRNIDTGEVVKSFSQGRSSLALSSMESMTYQFQWDQAMQTGEQATAGRYAIDVRTVQAELEKGENVLPAGAWDVIWFEILPPSGNG